MNSKEINCFISIAQTHNFTKTAQDLFMSESSVSKNIKKLEEELNLKLINRSRELSLTRSGEIILDCLTKIQAQFDHAVTMAREYEQNRNRPIILGASTVPIEREILPKLINQFREKYKQNIQIKYLDPSSKINMRDLLINKEIDLCLFQEDLFKSYKQLSYTPLFDGGFSLLMLKNNSLAHHNKINLQQLFGKEVYFWKGSQELPKLNEFKIYLQNNYSDLQIKDIQDMPTLQLYVKTNNAFGIVPSFLYTPDNSDFSFIPIKQPIKMTYTVAYNNDFEEYQYFDQLISMIKDILNTALKKWHTKTTSLQF